MKILFTLFALLPFTAMAQIFNRGEMSGEGGSDNCFATGRIHFSAGYMFPAEVKKNWNDFKKFGDYQVKGIGTVNAGLEYGVTDELGITLKGIYQAYNAEWFRTMETDSNKRISIQEGFDYTAMGALIGANWQIYTTPFISFYVGGQGGYLKYDYKQKDNLILVKPEADKGLLYNGNFGVKFFPERHTGIMAEVNLGNVTLINAGLVFSFGK